MVKNLDNNIKGMDYYKVLVQNIIFDMLRVDTDAKRIYIDLNHTFSILFRANDVNDPEIVERISTIMEEFIIKYLETGTELIFLYTNNGSTYHKEIFPDWCKNRDSRVNFYKSTFLKNMLVKLYEFKKKVNLVKVINLQEAHACMYIHRCEFTSKKKVIVLSKDPMMHVIGCKNVCIYDGNQFYDLGDKLCDLPLEGDRNIIITDDLLPDYLALRGDPRSEYPGVHGIGAGRANNYIARYAVQIQGMLDHPHKEYLDKFRKLYDIKSMMDWYTIYLKRKKEENNNG